MIGVAAAYGVALDPSPRTCALLKSARPTAVNLAYAVDRVAAAADPLAEARALHAEEEAASDAIARHGAELLAGAERILTHCNTGALAAPGRGTALAVIAELADRGTLTGVLATETRPLLQGARLTAYELSAAGDPARADRRLRRRGADRGRGRGCRGRRAATASPPTATWPTRSGPTGWRSQPTRPRSRSWSPGRPRRSTPRARTARRSSIEERDSEEVRSAAGHPLALPDTACRNPAFDVTPARYLTALVTERGVARPPFAKTISRLMSA